MRTELGLLVTLAAAALGALLDSARRAASSRTDEAPPSGALPELRASLAQLERSRAAIDGAGPRLLWALAAISIASALVIGLWARCAVIAAVFVAVGAGLAIPAVRWGRELRADARSLDARIRELRAFLDARERGLRARADAPRPPS